MTFWRTIEIDRKSNRFSDDTAAVIPLREGCSLLALVKRECF